MEWGRVAQHDSSLMMSIGWWYERPVATRVRR